MDKYKIQPKFDSELTTTLFKAEALRYNFISGSTPKWLFYDLKNTLHLLESLSSVRIEGNQTTLIDAIRGATESENQKAKSEDTKELININNAIDYIEETISSESRITSAFIRELHSLAVRGLKRDGSSTPGAFRKVNVKISQSDCEVSSPMAIPGDIAELVDYINEPHEKKEDIIRIACVHHRFVQIHPFDNGNGRTARLLTYAMLMKYGFLEKKKTILNPSSIFCIDREKYYKMLAGADTGNPKKIENWCNYVANGILGEMDRMSKLLDKEFAIRSIILPAIDAAYESERLNELEYKILRIAVSEDIIQASDVSALFGTTPSDKTKCSRFLSGMVERNILYRPPKSPKKYVARFFNKSLLSFVMDAMRENGLVEVEE